MNRPRRWAAACSLLVISIGMTACGYRVAGKASRLPTHVRTITIPAFVNQTQQYKLEQILTQAVVREFVTRTQYRIVSQPETEGDAILTGAVTNVQIAPVTFDSRTGRASTVLVAIAMRVRLADRQGHTIFENPNYVFREQYQVSRELSSFFQEEGPAMDRLSREFARTLVSNVLEAF
ncbi:MAG TPA: LPS assembly lipoprotein LptE [Terriglobales bacterium]|nr:LPS assembly lipoprotein LptE [Terriglobales bacterium]